MDQRGLVEDLEDLGQRRFLSIRLLRWRRSRESHDTPEAERSRSRSDLAATMLVERVPIQ